MLAHHPAIHFSKIARYVRTEILYAHLYEKLHVKRTEIPCEVIGSILLYKLSFSRIKLARNYGSSIIKSLA